MAKEFVKVNTSLVDVSGDKIRNFACLEDVRAAILAGELAEGDMFTTICQTTGQTEDIAREVCRIASYIPDNTSPTNQLMNHCDFAQIESDIECRVQCCDFTDYTTANDACMSCRVQCCDFNDFVTNISSYVSDRVCCSDYTSGMATKVDCTDYNSYVTSNDAAVACRVQCCDFTDFQTTNTTALNGKVTCTDYQTCCTAWDTAIDALEAKPGLDCVGTVTSVTVNGTACPVASGVVAITDVASASGLSTLSGTVSDLSTCPGLSCTGTLVPSDLDAINTCIACLKACPGLDCTGTVTGSRVSCSDFESCCSTWNTCISCLKSCSGLDCTGTLTSSDLNSYATKSCVCTIVNGIFSLSGNVLTITSA